jgi:nucleoside-diphosphate-sugar epimerase
MPFVPEPVHDYLDVDDFVDALLIIKDKGKFEGEIYEVGSGFQIRNEDVKDTVERIIGKKANLKYVDSMRSYDTVDWKADTERIKSLGWEQQHTLYNTIENMIDYERERLQAEYS